MARSILAVTMGDPGGIGPEVIAKSLRDFKIREDLFYLLIGTPEPFEYLADAKGLGLPLNPIPTLEAEFLREDSINFLDISEEARWILKKSRKGAAARDENTGEFPEEFARASGLKGAAVFDVGKVSLANASTAFAALKVAAYQAATGLIAGIVTAPVNKTSMRLIDPKFRGHTEFLAKISKVREYAMMFVSDRLKVTLVTIHVPLKRVSRLITEEAVLEKIRLTAEFLRGHFNRLRPKIAVCALNPHGRETGDEDEAQIAPAVRRAQMEKIEASGPLSADQLFHEAYEGRFDAVVAMYHDQGLAPFKMIAFHDGVNVTLGLPFVRTSPDHGTAFEIAYQGKADPRSMKAALDLAGRLI